MTYYLQGYQLPENPYKKAEIDFSNYVPFVPFTRKTRWQLGNGVRGRYFPGSNQVDLLDDAPWETEEVYTHEARHKMNPSSSESDVRTFTKNVLKRTYWH